MSRFKSFTEDSLSFCIANISTFDQKIVDEPRSNEWLNDYFSDHKLQSTPFDFDIHLKYDFNEPNKYDYENTIAIYELFKKNNVGEARIFSDKFIPAFTLQYGYEYFSSHRISQKYKIQSLKNTLFFDNDPRRSMAYQLVGRLYLLVRMSIDEREDDIYKYTKYVLNHSGLRRMVFYTFVDNKIASLALIKAVYDYENKHGTTVSTGNMHTVLTHLSCLSNVNNVPTMIEEEVYNEMLEFLEEEKL